MPQYLALKVCFIGYNFAGKKTQAKQLAEEFGLQTYQLSDLVDEVLAFYEQNPEPVAQPDADNAEEHIEEDPTMSDDSEEVGNSYKVESAREDFRLCGLKISELLKDGQEISDEVYVQLYVSKLRLTYPYKSKKQIRSELRKKVEWEREQRKKIAALVKELEEIANPPAQEADGAPSATVGKRKKKQDPAQIEVKINELQAEIDESKKIEKNGWILLDFPSTFAQAKLLETALSGYVPSQEMDSIPREKNLSDAFLLVQPTGKEQPPKTLKKSCLDAVIWFDLTREECMRRAIGRRIDPQDDKIYHVEDVSPPTNLAPLCERLLPMEDDNNAEATLIDRWISFD